MHTPGTRGVLTAALLLLASLLVSPAEADVHRNAPEPRQYSEAADAIYDEAVVHLQAEEFEQAVPVLKRLVEAHPEHGLGWYQLAYCHLLAGRNAEAAECWERSFQTGVLRPHSRYNQACAYALSGETERALDALAHAMELGYVDVASIDADTDLDSIRDTARYRELTDLPPAPTTAGGTEVSFPTHDGDWTVYGHFYRAKARDAKAAPTLLLFHQSGSNHAEYFPIAPKLTALGYNCLAIDARGGAPQFGRRNQTVDGAGSRGGGNEAIHDFRGALAYLDAEGYAEKRVLWGSSYSAGRLFAVVAEGRADIAGVVSMSPGRAFAGIEEGETSSWASRTQVPAFMAWPEWEYDSAALERFDAIASPDRWLYVPTEGGAHGSSMLRPDRNPKGHEAAFAEVAAFLAKYVPTELTSAR